MFERPRSGERAVLVHLNIHSENWSEHPQEFEELATSAGAEVVALIGGSRSSPDARLFVGSGKAEEIASALREHQADLVLFNHTLSPSQERNLERVLQCRVLDRTGLILDIFAQRARSFEGKLQVELAQLNHLSTRLVRGWTHLERQKGGIGLRGPGETQLETDRRLLGDRIKQLQRKLAKVRKQRDMGGRARRRASVPTISLVGYTNAGKSTLFNHITGAGVYVADQLFATLDPTLRKISLPGLDEVVLADTVGFIRQLPHDLVEAFRSTLEETSQADLLLHVIDASDDEKDAYIEQVNEVLQKIGAAEVPQIKVYNKIDQSGATPRVDRDENGKVIRVWVSAVTGEGLELLQQAMVEHLMEDAVHGWVRLPAQAGRVRAQLFALGAVLGEEVTDQGGWLLEIQLPRRELNQLEKREKIIMDICPDEDELLATELHAS